MLMPSRTVTLTGWGRVAPSSAELAEPASAESAAMWLNSAAPSRGVIARGLGRSYNNAAQCEGGVVISTARLNRIIELNAATGLAICEAGVSLEQLMVAGLPAGWFVPVSPGTRQVTIGGAIAADVHGKNHHVAGSFAMHVPSFDLLLPATW
jgi:decaprenylphospho-beta-D-ribofuranose 2-oxidase